MQESSSIETDNTAMSVLVVDDDTQLRLLYRYKLEEEGYRVFEASTGQEAIDIYREETPSLILMDAVMPGMDGFIACEKIIQIAHTVKPIILMTTSLDDEKSVNKAYTSGADDYITKPIHWAVLTNRINHILKANSVELLQQKLEKQHNHARKMATIYRMVGGIAHDFNNLLTGVIGYTELALELTPEKSVRLKKYLLEIDKSGSKAKSLIQKLLTFSQDSPGNLVPTVPNSIVSESLTMIRESFPPSIEIIENIDEHLPQVLMDPVHIYQTIINLCLNAKYAMNNKGKLTVSLHTQTLAEQTCSSCMEAFKGDYLELSVQDTGRGIENKNLHQIFDPFFSTDEMSTGLGLSVVHGIVHEHKGHILAESDAKHGALFRIFLPLQKTLT